MQQVAGLVLLLVALGWYAVGVPLAGENSARPPDPQWRRTNAGWVKVGNAGAAAFVRRATHPAAQPPLHPALLAAFNLFSGVLALMLFDRPHVRASLREPT